MLNDILDADEVAQLLRVHPRTISRLASQGKIPGFKAGDQWRFQQQALEEYMKKQEQRYQDQEGNKDQ